MRSELLPLLLLGLLLALLAGLQVWVSNARYDLSRHSKVLMSQLSELRYRVHQLELERATLIRPERLRRIARDRLGMVPPQSGQVIGR
ncbi:MAG: cell division protein FtsL [Mariprofundales bacterium]|nr:cell division protein FtsL [Mariprofundales bacterium]